MSVTIYLRLIVNSSSNLILNQSPASEHTREYEHHCHLRKFAGHNTDWLIRSCIWPTRSRLLVYVQYWLDNEMDNSWRQVAAGELLQPGPGSAIAKPNLWPPTMTGSLMTLEILKTLMDWGEVGRWRKERAVLMLRWSLSCCLNPSFSLLLWLSLWWKSWFLESSLTVEKFPKTKFD